MPTFARDTYTADALDGSRIYDMKSYRYVYTAFASCLASLALGGLFLLVCRCVRLRRSRRRRLRITSESHSLAFVRPLSNSFAAFKPFISVPHQVQLPITPAKDQAKHDAPTDSLGHIIDVLDLSPNSDSGNGECDHVSRGRHFGWSLSDCVPVDFLKLPRGSSSKNTNFRRKFKYNPELLHECLIRNGKSRRLGQRNSLRASLNSVHESGIGKLELSLIFQPNANRMEIRNIRLVGLIIRPENFFGALEVFDEAEYSSDQEPCLVRTIEGELILKSAFARKLILNFALLPSRAFSKQTISKSESADMKFKDVLVMYGIQCHSTAQSRLAIHVLCKFESHDEPIIIGEAQVALKDMQYYTCAHFEETIGAPISEVQLEDVILNKREFMGELSVKLSFNPITQKLSVRIVGARDLPTIGVSGAPRAAVKVNFFRQNLRIAKARTKVNKHSRTPLFNETFEFDMCRHFVQEYDLLFEVRHQGVMYRTVLGYVLVGSSASTEGATHWKQVVVNFESAQKSHPISKEVK